MSPTQPTLTLADVETILWDLFQSEICHSRNVGQHEFQWLAHDDEYWLNDRGLAIDSLERMAITSAVHSLFDLSESELGDRLLITDTFTQYARLVHQHMSTEQLFFRSSGSTGNPRSTPHRLTALTEEAQQYEGFIKPQRIVCLVPTHHIYGFIWGVLLPRLQRVPVLYNRAARQAAHGGLQTGDLIVALPSWWKYLAHSHYRLPRGSVGITSTAPLTLPVHNFCSSKGLRPSMKCTAPASWQALVFVVTTKNLLDC